MFGGLLCEGSKDLLVIPEWAFDIMHACVYQFQEFCQYRTSSSDKRKEEDWELLRKTRTRGQFLRLCLTYIVLWKLLLVYQRILTQAAEKWVLRIWVFLLP